MDRKGDRFDINNYTEKYNVKEGSEIKVVISKGTEKTKKGQDTVYGTDYFQTIII